jgi:hypothetical protein
MAEGIKLTIGINEEAILSGSENKRAGSTDSRLAGSAGTSACSVRGYDFKVSRAAF